MKIKKESAFQAEEIMVYLKELQVWLKYGMYVWVDVCVYVFGW